MGTVDRALHSRNTRGRGAGRQRRRGFGFVRGVPCRIARLVFFARDGNLWIDVHRALFPARDSAYLYGSRQALLSGDAEFDRYFDAMSSTTALHVDLFSTGSSFSSDLFS